MALALQILFIALCLLGGHMAVHHGYTAVSLTLYALSVGMVLNLLIDHTRIGHQVAVLIGA